MFLGSVYGYGAHFTLFPIVFIADFLYSPDRLTLFALVPPLAVARSLARLPILKALAALNEYHAAISETSVTIRNKPAYLMGILRKYKQGQRAPVGNGSTGGMATSPNAMGRMGVRGEERRGDRGAGWRAAQLEKAEREGFVLRG